MTDYPRKPVLGRLPVDGTDEEMDAWAEGFVEAVLGPETEDKPEPTLDLTDPGPLLVVDNYNEDDYPGDIWPTEDQIELAKWFAEDEVGEKRTEDEDE